MQKKIIATFLILSLSFAFLSAKEKNTPIPKRIVCLAPNGAEILYAIGCGEKIVARTDYCDFPKEVLKVPSVGGFDGKSFSAESVLAYNPDFVYLVDGMHNHLLDILNQFGIPHYESKAISIDSIYTEIEQISAIMGCTEHGKKLIKKLKSELAEITITEKNKTKPRVYVEIFSSPYMSIGKNSFMNDVINSAGGTNIFSDLDQSYPQVSDEAVIIRNPDFIIVPYYSTLQIETMYERDGWQSVSAIKNRKICAIEENIFSRPGPRFVEAVRLVKEILEESHEVAGSINE